MLNTERFSALHESTPFQLAGASRKQCTACIFSCLQDDALQGSERLRVFCAADGINVCNLERGDLGMYDFVREVLEHAPEQLRLVVDALLLFL